MVQRIQSISRGRNSLTAKSLSVLQDRFLTSWNLLISLLCFEIGLQDFPVENSSASDFSDMNVCLNHVSPTYGFTANHRLSTKMPRSVNHHEILTCWHAILDCVRMPAEDPRFRNHNKPSILQHSSNKHRYQVHLLVWMRKRNKTNVNRLCATALCSFTAHNNKEGMLIYCHLWCN